MADHSSAEFETALHCAEQLADKSKRILNFARGVVGGDVYRSQSGDEAYDEADVMVKSSCIIDAYLPQFRSVISRCGESLAYQNDRLIAQRFDPKPEIHGTRYDSAHEAIAGLAIALTCALRSCDHNPGDPVLVDRAVNVDVLRENLHSACRWIVDQDFAIDDDEIDGLLSDAGWESRQAKAALSSQTPTIATTSAPNGVASGIPPEHHTKIITKADAAKLLNGGRAPSNPTDYLDNLIKSGLLTPPIGNGHTWKFDIREFPESARIKLR